MELGPLSLMFPPLDRGGIFLPPVFLFEVEKGGRTKRSNFKGSPNVIVRESYSSGHSLVRPLAPYSSVSLIKAERNPGFIPKSLYRTNMVKRYRFYTIFL